MLWIGAVAFRYDPVKTCYICRCLRTMFPFGNNYVKVFFEVFFVRLRRVYRSMTMLRCESISVCDFLGVRVGRGLSWVGAGEGGQNDAA